VDDGGSRDEKQKRSAGVDGLERNELATITKTYNLTDFKVFLHVKNSVLD